MTSPGRSTLSLPAMHIRLHLLPLLILAAAGCGETRGAAPGPEPSAAVQALAAPIRSEPGQREGILLAVNTWDEGGYGLDPIAIVTPGGLRNVWDVEVDSLFSGRYYRPGMRYAVRVAGEPVGEASVIGMMEPGCSERIANAAVTTTRAMPSRWNGLASDVFGAASARPLMRAATAQEQAIVNALADSVHLTRGVPANLLANAEREGLLAVTVAGVADPVLVGSANVRAQRGGLEHVRATMVVAERRGGAYHPVYVFYADEDEDEMARRSLLDVADLDGDGVPEMITRGMFYEGWGYIILQRGPDGWTEIYDGGGGGC
jgi:hypothetical protein